MRNLTFAAALLLLSLAGLGVGTAHAQTEQEDDVSSPDVTVYVDGLACPFCAYGLEKKLDDLDAIRAMEVQVEKSRILVAFRKGRRASEDELRRAVKKAGFTVRKITFAAESPSAESG